jgi:hypothetical protein
MKNEFRLPEDFPPPNLPPGHSCNYEGDSGSFEGQRYYALYRGEREGDGESRRIGLFYDRHLFWFSDKFGLEGERIPFPSRVEMYNYIEAMCALNLWEIQDE